MLKLILIPLWGVALTLTTFGYFTGQFASTAGPTINGSVAFEDHQTDTLSISIFDKGQIVGHFSTRIRYQLPSGLEKNFPIPIDHMIGDGLNEILNEWSFSQIKRLKRQDLKTIENQLSSVLSKRRTPLPVKQVRLENARILLK